ncbi:MAG: GGDEF domain-containing protein [Lachnospiraceae bacterium]|nr:GGDEF domain-containing protein [Lachnospiraceae bacterium]
MITQIRQLIRKGSASERESDNLLFLTRYILLLLIPHTIVIGILSSLHTLWLFTAGALLFTALFIACFVASYRIGTGRISAALAVFLSAYAFIFSIGLGWRYSFQLLLFVCIFVFWYDITRSVRMKMFLSIATGLVFSLISAMSPIGSLAIPSDTLSFKIISYGNILFSTISLSIIAYFFCTQFAEAERKLYLYNRELKRIAETDTLTKLPNRRFALDELEHLQQNYAKDGQLVSFAIGDIDFFKNVNDNFGHDAGDYILSSVSALFNEFMRDYGFVARWGGEEFLFVFESANGDEAYTALDTLREKIGNTVFSWHEEQIPITITFGVEEYSPHAGIENTIAAADKKLYIGKEGGRNRVVF